MLDWRFYSAVVFVCVAVGSFLYKRAKIVGVRSGSFIVVQSFFYLCTVLAAGLLLPGGIEKISFPVLGVLTGALGITGAFCVLQSLQRGELGTNIAVVRLSFVPTALGAILFLGEPLTLQKALLVLMAGLAVFLFFDHYRRENRIALGSLFPAVTACVAFGVFDLLYKVASNRGVDPLTFLIVQSATAHILINLYVALLEKYELSRAVFRFAPVCGALFALASLAMLRALREADVSLIAPFIQTNFILSYLLGVVFLGESVTKRKLLGIATVVLCVLLLTEGLCRRLGGLWSAG